MSKEFFIDINDIKIKKNGYNYNINDKYLCKIVDISKKITKTKMIMNEIYFYNNLYNHFCEIINIIPFYKNIESSNKDIQGIICKNIINDYKLDYYEDINIIYIIIDNISKLHIQYWGNVSLLNNDKVSILNNDKYNGNYIIENYIKINIKNYFYTIFNNENKDNEILQLFDKLLKEYDSYLLNSFNFLSNNNKNETIINGMLQIDNIIFTNKNKNNNFHEYEKMLLFSKDNALYFRDWNLYKKGYGIEDIIHLLIFSTKTDFLIKNYNQIFIYYKEIINKNIEYTMEMLTNHIKYVLLDYILYKMIELYIKNIYFKLPNDKFDVYLNNYKFLVDIYFNSILKLI
jgi:hypothetical protein